MENYSIISWNGHDIKVYIRDGGVYLETVLYQMGKTTEVGQFYKLSKDLTGNEYDNCIRGIFDSFVGFYERCK